MAHVLKVAACELGHPVAFGIDVEAGNRSAHGARDLMQSRHARCRRAAASAATHQKSSMNGAAISATPMTTSHVTLLTKYG